MKVPGARNGILNKYEFKNGSAISYNVENHHVSSFELIVKTKLGVRYMKSKGNKITPAMKRKIGKLKSGDRIWIDEIKVTFPNGNIKNMGSWTLIIE